LGFIKWFQSLERDWGSVSSASMRFVIYTGSLTEIPKVMKLKDFAKSLPTR
jgi:hypothetical protein